MQKLQNEVKYLFINKLSDLYNQSMNLIYREVSQKFNVPMESIFDEYEDNSMIIVACINNKVIGHARLFIENSTAEISQVVIDEKYRGMKIGTTIIKNLINKSIEENVKIIGVDAIGNTINFYRTLGFQTLGDISFSQETELPHIRMIKER